MSATQFTVDMRDIEFVLFDQLDIVGQLSAIDQFAGFDQGLYQAMLGEAERLAVEVLHPINGPGDREGCHLEGNDVHTPKGYKAAWDTFTQNGWLSISAPPEAGGMGMPYAFFTACNDMFSGAAMAFTMYPGLTAAAARVIHHHAPDSIKGFAEKMYAGQWAGTMCLTEAGAGSDVGNNRCKAERTDEAGVYTLTGEKIFISGGDQDLTENIIHLVLARTPDAPNGTRGLSLFMVPKVLVNDDGSLGERNDARVVGIEHKMGINGSATSTLALGSQGTCKGWLIGEEGRGMSLMFIMMNEARIGVGAQGAAIGAAAYNYALSYAKERLQGSNIKNFKNPDAPMVPIIEHADVRRMLMEMKVTTETMRALVYRIALLSDKTESGALEGEEKEKTHHIVDLLVPIVKAACTDLGFNNTVTAVQVFGGYGYIGEYPVEQCLRDAKIMSIYEGTNGIQALDLLGRKLRQKNGALFMTWMSWVQAELAAAGAEGFEAQAGAIGKAVQSLGASIMHLGQLSMTGKLESALAMATPLLNMFGYVVLAYEALDQARVAKKKIEAEGESNFLVGKLLNLDFFVSQILPRAVALSKEIRSGDQSVLDPRLFA